MTGSTDYVTDGSTKNRLLVKHNVPELQAITATGCSLSSLVGAFVALGVEGMEKKQSAVWSAAHARLQVLRSIPASTVSLVFSLLCPAPAISHLPLLLLPDFGRRSLPDASRCLPTQAYHSPDQWISLFWLFFSARDLLVWRCSHLLMMAR